MSKVCELENNPQFVLEVNRVTDLKISMIQVNLTSCICGIELLLYSEVSAQTSGFTRSFRDGKRRGPIKSSAKGFRLI